MSLIDRLLKDLFPDRAIANETSPIKEVLVKEMIKRNKVFLDGYQAWKGDEMHLGILAHLKEASMLKFSNPEAEVNFFHYRDAQSNGFYFHGEDPWTADDYSYLIQHFIDLLKREEYYLNNAKREVVEEERKLKTVEHFYLKPKLKFRKEMPYEQLYGNVEIEHRLVEGKTNLVKVMVNVYNDRNFKEPADFETLLPKFWLP
jgi:hypothetical protein